MSEMKPVTVERAREALEDMDDYARMDAGVDAQGPRETLERFIAEHERVVAELQTARAEYAGRARLAETRMIEAEQRAERAEVRVAELEAENARLRDEAASALALLARMRAACGDDGRRMQGELEAYLRELRADAERVAALERDVARAQARIDALMLEYCPDEMTPEQVAEWSRHQRPVSEQEADAIDAARQQENA